MRPLSPSRIRHDATGWPGAVAAGPRVQRLLAEASIFVLVGALAVFPAEAKKKSETKASPAASARDQQAPAPEPQPYRAQLTRLAEILGALTYLDEICAKEPAKDWRVSMRALMDAQAWTASDRELMAGAFNRNYRGYRITYRICTANARFGRARFLEEGERIAHEVADRYGSF
jgi:uncharacterized protein (TIGR02301 family)